MTKCSLWVVKQCADNHSLCDGMYVAVLLTSIWVVVCVPMQFGVLNGGVFSACVCVVSDRCSGAPR